MPDREESTKALEQAQLQLRQAQSRWPAIHRIAAQLREMREDNHFAERLAEIFKEKK